EIYYRHFIRGYFDGDGSLVLSKNSINFKICGTKEFLEKLREVFNSCSKYSFKNVLFKRKKDNKNNYYLSFGGRYKTLSVMNYLYDKSEVYLDRKYKKFILLKSM
ncbi:LAGLIDADG family homing endonuclease, partial [Clostridium butyricum]